MPYLCHTCKSTPIRTLQGPVKIRKAVPAQTFGPLTLSIARILCRRLQREFPMMGSLAPSEIDLLGYPIARGVNLI